MSSPSNERQAVAERLSGLQIDRDAPRRRRWLPWAVLAVSALLAVLAFPSARDYYEKRRAPEVEVARATQIAQGAGGGAAPVPVLVATGYVVARRSSDVGVKTGGRIELLSFEEGTKVRAGQVLARIEHADLDAQLVASQAAVAEAETQVAQSIAQHDEDVRQLERQRSLMRDGITTPAALTAAEAAELVSGARIRSGEAAIVSARARIRVIQESLENTNVRAPFEGVVIKKRAEVGETVSPFGVTGQSSREGGAIATIADLRELEVQTEVSENNVAKLHAAMPAAVKLQAYPDQEFQGRVRAIFPSADRAKAIVEVRVTIVEPSPDVKPEMTASVTFQNPPTTRTTGTSPVDDPVRAAPAVVVSRRAIVDRGGQASVWVVVDDIATRRPVTLGQSRLDQVEVSTGLMPGELVILNAPPEVVDHGRVRVRGA